MALEYRLTLAGTVPMDEVATRAFPDPADRLTPTPSGKVLSADLDARYGVSVDIVARTAAYYSAPTEADYWEWEPGASVDLTFEMAKDADRFDNALRHTITAIARVLISGTEDAALMLSGDRLLLTRINGVVTKHDRADWWDHYGWPNEVIPG